MSYRNSLIQRLQDDGTWDRMTIEEHKRIHQLTEEKACSIMARVDGWVFGEKDAEETIGTVLILDIITRFKNGLVEIDTANKLRLSKAGTLLANFVEELRTHGLTPDEIEDGFRGLTLSKISALMTLYKNC
jgi:hypothetical protein